MAKCYKEVLMNKRFIPFSGNLGTEVAFSDAVEVSARDVRRVIYVSGMVAVDEAGNAVGKEDMKAQTRRALENVQSALGKLSATMDDIVKVTVFVTDLSRFKEIHEVRREFFKKGAYPASTLVKVAGLVHEDLMIEIEAVAMV